MLEGLEISVIRLSEILEDNENKRIDSEYFKKQFLNFFKNVPNLRQLGSLVKDGYRVVYENTKIIDKDEAIKKNSPIFLQATDLETPFINTNNLFHIDNEQWSRYPKGRITKGEILIEVKGKIDKVAIVPDDFPEKTLVSGSLFKLTVNNSISKNVLLTYLISKFGVAFKDRYKTNLLISYVSKPDLYRIPIPSFSSSFEKLIDNLFETLFISQKTSKQLYQQAEDTLMFEVGLNTLNSDFLRKLELELKPNKTPEETMEYLEKYSNTARNSFEAAHDIFMDMLDVHPNLIEDLLERGEVEIAKLLQQGMETKMKLQEYDIQQAQKNKELLIKGYEAQTNLMDLSEARLKNFNIKKLSDSFIKTGRLDAEYYQQKYEVIENVIKKNKYERLAKIVEIEKSIEPGSNYYTEEAGLPFYRVSDYNKLGLSKPNKELSKSFVEENQNLIEKIKPKKGTILFSKDGSVGTAYLLRENLNGITSGAILHLKIKDNKKIIPEYLTLTLNSNLVKMQAERDAGGSIILHWRKEEIEQVLVPILDINKQKEIADLVEQSFKLKTESERLLDVAKKAVEIAIEEGEENAMDYIKKN